MLLCAKPSWRIKSPGPIKCPTTVSFVECPPAKVIASSLPSIREMAFSSSMWIGLWPDTSRLAEALVP